MKGYKIIICFIAFSFLISSCSKHLELEPISVISTASYWKTEDDADGAIRGMYARFRNVTATNLYIWGESRSMNLQQSVGNDFAHIRSFDNTLDATAAGPDWSSVYRVVNDANLVLKYVPNIIFKNEVDKNRIIAEAYTMRAYCYFIMVKTWGDVPLVLEPTEGYNPDVLYKVRASVSDVFNQIKADLSQALSLYSDNSFSPGRGRWSRPALNALKGEVYLWTGKRLAGGEADFSIALNALEEVGNADVELLGDFESVFNYDNKGNKEVIMVNTFLRNESPNTYMANMYIDAYPPNSDPDALGAIGAVGGGNYWTLTAETRSKFVEEDQRKHSSFTELYFLEESTGAYTNFYGCIQRKFNGMVESGVRHFIDDVVLYRYADVLLMIAEVQNALNQDPSDAINLVRARAFGQHFDQHIFVNQGKEENDRLILEERLKEFLYEGKYWWDILRFGKAQELIPYFRDNPSDTYKYIWPLSLGILSAEPNVTQNPGYQ